MMKTIKSYDVETVKGVARFLNDGQRITEMLHDYRVDAKDAVIDFNNAVKQAELTGVELAAVELVRECGVELTLDAKRIFFAACRKIASVFRAQEYGRMEITKYI